MTAKLKKSAVEIKVVDTEAPLESPPITEQQTELPPTPKGRVPWCVGCWETQLEVTGGSPPGPEAKLDSSGHPRVYTPGPDDQCYECGEPAAHLAPYLAVGDRYAHRDGSTVTITALSPLSVLDVGGHPSTARKVDVSELVCL